MGYETYARRPPRNSRAITPHKTKNPKKKTPKKEQNEAPLQHLQTVILRIGTKGEGRAWTRGAGSSLGKTPTQEANGGPTERGAARINPSIENPRS